ncbi:MAG: hypothetical protein GEU86_22510 [Actinophytocola sp.]|nr:hypothetical protein [Actinophytocola sp.]
MPKDRKDLVELVLREEQRQIERVRAQIDPDDGDTLHEHLVAAIKRNNLSTRDIAKYVLDVYKPGFSEPQFGFTALSEQRPR